MNTNTSTATEDTVSDTATSPTASNGTCTWGGHAAPALWLTPNGYGLCAACAPVFG